MPATSSRSHAAYKGGPRCTQAVRGAHSVSVSLATCSPCFFPALFVGLSERKDRSMRPAHIRNPRGPHSLQAAGSGDHGWCIGRSSVLLRDVGGTATSATLPFRALRCWPPALGRHPQPWPHRHPVRALPTLAQAFFSSGPQCMTAHLELQSLLHPCGYVALAHEADLQSEWGQNE